MTFVELEVAVDSWLFWGSILLLLDLSRREREGEGERMREVVGGVWRGQARTKVHEVQKLTLDIAPEKSTSL